MQNIKDILLSIVAFTFYKIGWVDDNTLSIINHRKNKCKSCPLRKGIFCSKRKMIGKRIIDNNSHEELFQIIKGCGCILPLKQISKSKCPLNKWRK